MTISNIGRTTCIYNIIYISYCIILLQCICHASLEKESVSYNGGRGAELGFGPAWYDCRMRQGGIVGRWSMGWDYINVASRLEKETHEVRGNKLGFSWFLSFPQIPDLQLVRLCHCRTFKQHFKPYRTYPVATHSQPGFLELLALLPSDPLGQSSPQWNAEL